MKEQKYKLNKGFIFQEIEHETVIFDGENSVLFSFNETASFIFKRLKKGHEVDKIIKALMKSYDVNEAVAKKDIADLLKKLIKKKIISKK